MTDTPPSSNYRVQLDAYAGPLDLLLHLVKRHEIDLHDIPIKTLTQQYLEHLKVIQSIDVENAGEFLVMAATLLEVKSQMLVPRIAEENAQDSDDPTDAIEESADPRYELVQQLLAYKRYKDAALALEDRALAWSHRHATHPQKISTSADDADERDFELEDANVMDLCQAFARILETVGQVHEHAVTYDDTPISLHAQDVYDLLSRTQGRTLSLEQIFAGRSHRSEMVGLFLATLELVRSCRVRVIQSPDATGESRAIQLEAIPEDQQEQDANDEQASTDWRDPETGEIQYDWPDPTARAISERRAKRRAQHLAKQRDGQPAEDNQDDDPYLELNDIELHVKPDPPT